MRKSLGSCWYALQPDDYITYFEMNKECCFCGVPEGMVAKLRRRGEECWQYCYTPTGADCNGNIGVRWSDHDISCLKPGRYELAFFVGCDKCASYEIMIGNKADVVPGIAYSVKRDGIKVEPDTEPLEIC